MSAKTKFFLVIIAGTLFTTLGTVLLFNRAQTYPDTDIMYFLFVGLSILLFLAGVTIIIIWTSRIEN